MKAINKYVITEEIEVKRDSLIIIESKEEKIVRAKVISSAIKEVKKGDTVLFDRYISQDVEYNNKKYLVVNGEDLLAKINA